MNLQASGIHPDIFSLPDTFPLPDTFFLPFSNLLTGKAGSRTHHGFLPDSTPSEGAAAALPPLDDDCFLPKG